METAELPKSFLKNKFLVPHNFSNPEDPDHAFIVHMDLKTILFDSVWSKISMLESVKHWEKESGPNTFWLQSIDTVECSSQDLTWFENKIIERNVSKGVLG